LNPPLFALEEELSMPQEPLCERAQERKRETKRDWSCLSLKQCPSKARMSYFWKRSYQPKRGNGDKTLEMCFCFSQGHLELLLARYGFPVPSPQDGELRWSETRNQKWERYRSCLH